MLTVDDKVFCILHSCYNGLSTQRLTDYIYLYQLMGTDFEFKYKITPSGVNSRGVDLTLNELINNDKIAIKDGVLSLTLLGEIHYENIALTNAEWSLVDNIKSTLDKLSDEELNFIVLVDIMIDDVRRKGGAKSLIKNNERIVKALKGLSKVYSDDNFNSALKLTKMIREGSI